ncbi:MAG TPA: DUF4173 domain-containing protein [Firmicutes bacterium]|nr:DUF4173 domain-containing protein [Bacillota bacterium]
MTDSMHSAQPENTRKPDETIPNAASTPTPASTVSPIPQAGQQPSLPAGTRETTASAPGCLAGRGTVPVIQMDKHFSVKERIAAFLALGIGYLFVRLVLSGSLGIGACIFFLIVLAFSVWCFFASGRRMGKHSVLQLGILVLFSLNLLFSANPLLKTLDCLFLIAAGIYWIYASCQVPEGIRRIFLFDWLKAAFFLPFRYFGAAGRAMISASRSKTKLLKHFLIGLCIALPLTFIVTVLLLLADDTFRSLLDGLIGKIFLFIWQFAWGIPVAFYLFGLLFACIRDKNLHTDGLRQYRSAMENLRVVPSSTLIAVSAPLCLVYLLFIISQFIYLFHCLTTIQTTPETFQYAAYARQGFFELCLVSLINLGILSLTNLLTRYKDGKKPVGIRVVNVLVSVFTLFLIGVAMIKMILYIDAFGFTRLRIYTSWFMVLVAVVFIVLLIQQFRPKMHFAKAVLIPSLLLFFLLSFMDTDAVIAKYNVEWYRSGKHEEIDIQMFYDLSSAAAPYVIPLMEDSDPKVAAEAEEYLHYVRRSLVSQPARSFNLSAAATLRQVTEALNGQHTDLYAAIPQLEAPIADAAYRQIP